MACLGLSFLDSAKSCCRKSGQTTGFLFLRSNGIVLPFFVESFRDFTAISSRIFVQVNIEKEPKAPKELLLCNERAMLSGLFSELGQGSVTLHSVSGFFTRVYVVEDAARAVGLIRHLNVS